MIYSAKSVGKMEQDPYFLWDYGFALRFQRGKKFSFIPRFTYFGQGISIKDDLNYRLRLNAFSFSFPLELQYDLKKERNVSIPKFFIYAGPYISLPVSARIMTNDYSKWVGFKGMNKINYGGEVGVGFRIPTYSVEGSSNVQVRVSYLRGFNDTYTKFERDITDQSLRDKLYINDGKRFNSAIKLTVGVEIPFKTRKYISFTAGGDGKKNYKRVVVIDEK